MFWKLKLLPSSCEKEKDRSLAVGPTGSARPGKLGQAEGSTAKVQSLTFYLKMEKTQLP